MSSATLITNPKNIQYLSGFRGSFGQLFLTSQQKFLFTDFRYLLRAKNELNSEFKIINIIDSKEIMSRYKKIEFEADHLTCSLLSKLKEVYPDTVFKQINKPIEDQRAIKSEQEIKLIKKAVRITDQVFSDLKKYIKLGMTEKELALEIEIMIKKRGGEGVSFPPMVAFSKNSAIPHHEPTNKKLKKGDNILLDFGAKYKGYCADMTRNIFTTYPSVKEKEIYDIVLKAQLSALAYIKAERKISSIDKQARQIIDQAGYSENFGHALGHGVGLDIHESPSVSHNTVDPLKEGMVITIEPGIYLADNFGVRIEDMVVVKKDGGEVLTRSSKGIIFLFDNFVSLH